MFTIDGHFVHVLLKPNRALGVNARQLIAEVGIPQEAFEESESCIRVEDQHFAQLLRRVWELTGDEFLGFTKTPCRAGHFSLAAQHVLNFTSLKLVILELCRFYNTVRDDVRFEFKQEGDRAGVVVMLREPELDVDHFLTEFLLCIFHRFFCWITDIRIPLLETTFSIPMPTHADKYIDIFPGSITFDQNLDGFFFECRFLERKVTRTRRECEIMLSNSPFGFIGVPGTDNSMTATVRGILVSEYRKGDRFPDFGCIARILNLPEQTLRRRLIKENRTYQQIRTEILRDIAIDRLVHSEIPIAEVGFELGFIEPASFSRAFYRWTGQSPSDYRQSAEN